MLIENKGCKEIAAILLRSVKTIEKHKQNIYKKLNVNNRSSLIRFNIKSAQMMLLLTAREKQVYQLLAQGYSSRKIAEKLKLSIHTVNEYRKNIKQKYAVLGGF